MVCRGRDSRVCALGLTMLIYWFNLDNKAIYYLVRPMLNKLYNKQKRDVKL